MNLVNLYRHSRYRTSIEAIQMYMLQGFCVLLVNMVNFSDLVTPHKTTKKKGNYISARAKPTTAEDIRVYLNKRELSTMCLNKTFH